MAHVFISYSSKHLPLTEQLKAYLKTKGFTVWHDLDALEARGPFDGQISAGLQQAAVVIIIWTTDAIVSNWVNFEATYAADNNKLVNVEPEGIDRSLLPVRFRDHHRHVQSHSRPLDLERIFSDILAARDGKPLPAEVPERQHFEERYYELLLDPKRQPTPEGVSDTPSALLQAKYGIVEFIDIQGLKTQLVDWTLGCGHEPRRRTIAGRLVHGPGGVGKTRLMIEIAAALREAGWSAGFVNRVEDTEKYHDKRRHHTSALAQLIAHADDKGLALIIDYAEGRREEVKSIARQMQNAAKADPKRPRILFLLAREVGEWWENIRREEALLATVFSAGLGQTAQIAIREEIEPEERQALFGAARSAFANAIMERVDVNSSLPDAPLLAQLTQNAEYSRPLAILMAALLHVYGKALADLGNGMAPLLDGILDLEIGHWKKVLPGLDDTHEIERGTAQVTLVGGTMARAPTAALLMGDPYYRSKRSEPAATEATLRALSRLYGNGSNGLNGLEPDLVGEHLVLREAEWDRTHALALIEACVAWENGSEASRRCVITVLARATKAEHGGKAKSAESLLVEIVRRRAVDLAPILVEVALIEPQGRLAEVLVIAAPTFDDEALRALQAALPHRTVRLMDAAYVLAAKHVDLARQAASQASVTAHQRDRLATRLTILSYRLSALGRNEEALAASQEAVDIYRSLPKDEPKAFRAGRAASLLRLSQDLGSLGRHRGEQLDAAKDAVANYRALAKEDPERFLGNLTNSLSYLSLILSALDRRDESLAASQELIEIWMAMARDNPRALADDISSALLELGLSHSQMGNHHEAIAFLQLAARGYREAANRFPDYAQERLAGILGQIRHAFSQQGRHEEALDPAKEAIGLYRSLAKDQPGALLPDLARDLTFYAHDLGRLGRHEEALAASREAINIYQPLAKGKPGVFLKDLLLAVLVALVSLVEAGPHEEGAEIARFTLLEIATYLDQQPEAFSVPLDKVKSLIELYFQISMLAQQQPDGALANRAYLAASMAQFICVLAAAVQTGALDETALTHVPPDLKKEIQSAWAVLVDLPPEVRKDVLARYVTTQRRVSDVMD
jgi:hypothetical protein